MAEFSINIVDDGTGFNELEIAGENLVAGNLCYLGTDNKYYKASALAKSSSTTELRIALNSIPIDTKGLFLKRGKFSKSGLTSGTKYYISEVFGEFTNIQPNTTSTNVIRYVGTAWNNETLEFNDDATYILADGSEANEVTIAGVGGSGHIIQEEGTSLAARTNLNFIGVGVTATDNPGNSSTDITIVDSAAHVHSNFVLLETYDQTNAGITTAVSEAHNIYALGSKTVDETGLVNGDVLSFNSTSGNLEYVPQSGGVTDHTNLTSIGTNTHAQIDTHIADSTLHFTEASINITESQVTGLVGKYELDLGLPAADGYVLTSTAAGVRSWNSIAGGTPEVDTLHSVTSRGDTTINPISTGAITSSGQVISTKYTSAGEAILEAPAGQNTSIKAPNSSRIYIDSDNNSTSEKFEVLSNTNSYAAPNVVFSVDETGLIYSNINGTSQDWDDAYVHSLLVSGNPHAVNGSQVVLTGYTLPGSTSAVLGTDSTNAAIGKLEKAIDDINTSGPMTSFVIQEGNGTEVSTVTNGETIHFEQGSGIEVELTSTVSGGQLTFTNTDPNVNLIHTGEVTGAENLTIASNVVDLDNLNVGGTVATNKYLRYDSAGTGLIWDVPPDNDTNINTWRPVTLDAGIPLEGTETLTMKPGDGVSITEALGVFTFDTASYWKLEVDGVFKEDIAHKEAVSFDSGTGINVTGTTDTNPNVSFNLADNGVNALQLNVGGNGTTSQYLKSDGDGTFTWATPPDNNTIYSGWNVQTNGIHRNSITSGESVNFKNGTGITIDYSSPDITFNVVDNYLKNNANDTTTGTLTASAFYESSLRELKENIKPFERSALQLVNDLNIVTFDKKDRTVTDKIGIIIDESSKEFANKEHTKVDLYNTIFVQAKAIQELSDKLDKFEFILKNFL